MRQPTVLIIDDEPAILALVSEVLAAENYNLLTASAAAEAFAALENVPTDLVICDVNLPDMSGMDICRILKQRYPSLQLIFLSGVSDEIEKVLGMELGAEDYITKPFNPREFRTRIRVALRRVLERPPVPPAELPRENNHIVRADLRIDLTAYAVSLRNQPVELTKKEFELLVLLASHPGQVFTRDAILDRIWQNDLDVTDRSVDVLVRRLRDKIEANRDKPRFIETVRGFGYRFCQT